MFLAWTNTSWAMTDLLKNDWPMNALDGVLMMVVIGVFFVWYPDRVSLDGIESVIELVQNKRHT